MPWIDDGADDLGGGERRLRLTTRVRRLQFSATTGINFTARMGSARMKLSISPTGYMETLWSARSIPRFLTSPPARSRRPLPVRAFAPTSSRLKAAA